MHHGQPAGEYTDVPRDRTCEWLDGSWGPAAPQRPAWRGRARVEITGMISTYAEELAPRDPITGMSADLARLTARRTAVCAPMTGERFVAEPADRLPARATVHETPDCVLPKKRSALWAG